MIPTHAAVTGTKTDDRFDDVQTLFGFMPAQIQRRQQSQDLVSGRNGQQACFMESIHELQDLVKKIALKEKIEESREFASDVQRALHSGLAAKSPGIRDRGVRKAPFIVLIGANMPSILAEISFVSNPGDEHRLRTPEYRQRIAESLYRGISKYVSGLSGVKVASRLEKDTRQ